MTSEIITHRIIHEQEGYHWLSNSGRKVIFYKTIKEERGGEEEVVLRSSRSQSKMANADLMQVSPRFKKTSIFLTN